MMGLTPMHFADLLTHAGKVSYTKDAHFTMTLADPTGFSTAYPVKLIPTLIWHEPILQPWVRRLADRMAKIDHKQIDG